MGQFRLVNGVALGPENNFAATSANVFAEGDTTPDVTNGNLFFSNNVTSTVITDFELTVPGGGAGSNAGKFEGKVIEVIFLDDSTGLANNSRIITGNSGNFQGSNVATRFVYHNSSWILTGTNYNAPSTVSVNSNNIGSFVADTTSGTVNITGNTETIFGFAYATSPLVIRRVLNGQQGQRLTLVSAGPSDLRVIVNSAQAGTFVSTSSSSATQFRLASSGAISFVYQGAKWLEITPVWANSSITYTT